MQAPSVCRTGGCDERRSRVHAAHWMDGVGAVQDHLMICTLQGANNGVQGGWLQVTRIEITSGFDRLIRRKVMSRGICVKPCL
jgi:hypothetical protein